VLPIIGIRPLSGRTGTTLLMNLFGTSPRIAFDRRYPAEYRIGSYLVRMSQGMSESFNEGEHVGVTDFFFGPQPAWGPMPFHSDALDVKTWRPRLLRAMWASASDVLLAERPNAQWYAEKLAVDDAPLREAGVEVLSIDLVRDPRDVLVSRRAFLPGGTEGWARDAEKVASELALRLDELDAFPADMRLRYEDLACDLEGTAQQLADRLGVELSPSDVDRPEAHVTSASVAASVGRWRNELEPSDAAALTPIAERLGY
jgi:Sulfotransferase family